MAQGNPPVYQLVDSAGTVQSEIRHDLAQTLIFDQLNGTDFSFQDGDLKDITSLNIETGQIGPDSSERQLITTESKTYSVPGDYSEPQAAVNDIPLIVQHDYEISITDDFPNTDVRIPGFYKLDNINATGETANLNILFDSGNATAQIGSLFIDSVIGRLPLNIDGAQIQSDTPSTNNNENVGIFVRGSDEVTFRDIEFQGGTNGLLAYQADVILDGVNFGSNVLSGDGIQTKHTDAVVNEQKATAPATKGDVGGFAYNAQAGQINFSGTGSTLSGSSGKVKTGSQVSGRCYDYDRKRIYNTNRIKSEGGSMRLELSSGDDFEILDNETPTSIFKATGFGFGQNSNTRDLSGTTGDFDGQVGYDDGTNTPARNTLCVWDNVNNVWRPTNDPSGGSFS